MDQLGGARTAAAVSSTEETCTLVWTAPGAVSGCSAPVPAVVPAVPWLQHSGQAVDPGEIEQREPINIKFPGTVVAVTLSSTGALKCSGTLGRMVGYRNNVQVVQADNVLIEPSDCGEDDVTYGVQGQLPPDVDIDSLVIEGVDPWTFEVLGNCCGRARLNYTIQYQQDTTFHIGSLTCTPSPVVRANTVNCNATWSPSQIAAGEILFEWVFQGDSIRVFPAANAKPYDPPPPVDSTAQGMSGWSGPAVLGGRVSLRATWQGDVDSVATQIVVSPRTGQLWGDLPFSFDATVRDIVTDSTKTLAQQPSPMANDTTKGLAGLNVDSVTNSGQMAQVIKGWPIEAAVAAVPFGPNQGYGYFSAPGVRTTRGIGIRTWVAGREQPKFDYFRVPGTLLTNRGLLNAMRKNANGNQSKFGPDSAALFLGVRAHESYGQSGAKGHQQQIELAATSLPTCGRIPTILERVVGPDTSWVHFTAGFDVVNEGAKSLWAAADHDRVYGNFSKAPYYEVVSQVTVVDHTTPSKTTDDLQKQADPGTAPDSQWNCSRVY